MSYDRKIDQVCQHLVANETLYVTADRQTIKPLRPIATSQKLQVKLNGEILVPSTGVQLAPSAEGRIYGPFRIQAGVNDKFQVRVGLLPTVYEVTVPPTNSITTDQLVRFLNQSQLGVAFSNSGNRVVVQGVQPGSAHTFFLPSTNTLATALGISTNREYRGKDVTPGWSLIQAPGTVNIRPSRYIVFDQPLRSIVDFVEINYSTVQSECRRCGGTGVENDWRYTATGDVIQAVDEALLLQEMLKLIFTELGSNPFHTWYGTSLNDQIGRKISVGNLLQNLIVQDIYRAFGRWQSIKKQQEIAIGQFVSDAEYPYRLLNVSVQQSQQDFTVFFVNMTVQNRSQTPIVIDRGIRVPQPADLLGSTQEQGIFRESLSKYVLTG